MGVTLLDASPRDDALGCGGSVHLPCLYRRRPLRFHASARLKHQGRREHGARTSASRTIPVRARAEIDGAMGEENNVSVAAHPITLFVETERGTFVRRILPASLLPPDVRPGNAAETATRDAAAAWGLPDFVFGPATRRRGSGVRELGDAVVIAGERAACVQVKARPVPSTELARERGWLDKKIAEAARQSAGTIRAMRTGHPRMVNERGRTITLDGASKKWSSVTVLDHPGIEGYVPRGGSVVLLRGDWEFLFDQLKSTCAVLGYLERVGRHGHVELGTEPARYFQLALADERAPREHLDPRIAAHGRPISVPLLPLEPAAYGEIIRGVLEDVAESDWPDGIDPADVLEVLAAIDGAPLAYRAELGRDILEWLSEMPSVPQGEVRWRFRRMAWPGRPHLIFGAAPRFSDLIQEAFGAYVQLRHQEHLELTPEAIDLMTVGVLFTPRLDRTRPWDTTIAATRGEQHLDPPLRSALEGLWHRWGEGATPP